MLKASVDNYLLLGAINYNPKTLKITKCKCKGVQFFLRVAQKEPRQLEPYQSNGIT